MKHWQQVKEIKDLKQGDIIRGKSSGRTFMITDNLGTRAIGVTTQDVTNPNEWEVYKASNE